MTSTARPVLVTGSAGFIGSHLVEAFARAGCNIVGVDNFDPYYDESRKRANVQAATKVAREAGVSYELVEADICDRHAMSAVFSKHRPEGVVHIAAKAGVRPSIEDPVGYARTNVFGTSVILDQAQRAQCSRIVVASSSSVYGNNERVPFAETDDVNQPISPYAATKRSCEMICHAHQHLTQMPTACLRFFTVFGPRQRPDLAISKFLDRVSRGEAIPFFGDGTSSRDYTFVDDIVAGVMASYERISDYGYRIWNLGGNEPVSLSGLVETIGQVVGSEPIIDRQPMQPGDVLRTWADLSRSRAELGFSPMTSLREGIERQWEWMQRR